MAAQFSRSILKVSVAQICQNIGWHAVHQSTLELLADILHRYVLEIARTAQAYSNQDGRTNANLDDLSLAFNDLGILLSELEEYTSNVEPVPFVQRLAKFPVSRPSSLQHPKQGSRELLHRPNWVHEFLPPMHPELEEEESMLLSPGSAIDGMKREMASNSAGEEMSSPHGSPQPCKRNPDGTETPTPKRFRLCTEEEGQPMREVTSVFMTPSGFISPAREGKLPEPCAPSPFIGTVSPSLALDSDSSDSLPIPHKEVKLKELKKSFKLKKDNKDGKKSKASKKDNKENANAKKGPCSSLLFFPLPTKKSSSSNPMLKLKKKLTKGIKFSKEGGSKGTKIKSSKIKSKEGKSKEGKSKEGKSKEGKNKEGKIKEGKSKDGSSKSKSKSKNKGTGSSGPMGLPGLSPKAGRGKSPSKAKSPGGSKASKAEKKKAAAVTEPLPPPPFLFAPGPSPTPPPAPPPPPPAPILAPASPPPLPLLLPPTVTPSMLSSMTPLQVMACKAEEERSKLNAATLQEGGIVDDDPYIDDNPSREETPEPRLVIDDSPETLSKQEKESRLADIELCIDAVIQKAREESRLEEKRESALEVAMHGALPRKLEPRDVYDFTDSDSSPPPTPKTPDLVGSPAAPPPKKESKKDSTPEHVPTITVHPSGGDAEPPRKKTKEKASKGKKKSGKTKSSSGTLSPKKGLPKTPEMRASPLVALSQRAETPPELTPSAPAAASFSGVFPFSQQQQQHQLGALFSPKFPPFGSPPTQGFLPAFPFSQLRGASAGGGLQGAASHFPTPPLFVPPPPSRVPDEAALGSPPSGAGSGHVGPLVLGGSPFAVKTLAEKKAIPPMPSAMGRADDDKPSFSKADGEKGKAKDKKEKKLDKKDHPKKKPKEKGKDKSPKEKKEGKVKGKPQDKSKANKKVKVKLGKEKKKGKDEKKKDDSIPKITVKLGSTPKPSATKILFKALNEGDESPVDPFEASPPPSPVGALAPPSRRSPSPPVLSPALPAPAARGKGAGKGAGRTAPTTQQAPAPAPLQQQVEASSPLPAARMVITETVGTIVDERGNKIWICPACARPDDGSPMIGCDECDDWYHWVCVGIVVPPKEEESWYCTRCIAKRQGALAKKKKKKHRKEK